VIQVKRSKEWEETKKFVDIIKRDAGFFAKMFESIEDQLTI